MLYKEYLTCRRDYQELGHIFLLERKHACLYYKPGKGKTYPAIDALRDIDAKKNGNAKVLILSTADAIRNMWETEIATQNILPKNTVMVTFNSAIIDKRKTDLIKIKWDVIIVDECHKIKAHNTKISKLVYLLTKKVEYAWGLSGTPRGNNDIDIFCQFHNLNVSEWGAISYTNFITLCCDVEKKFFGSQIINSPIGINEKYKTAWENNVATYSQRIGYTEEDGMPDLNINVVKLPYKPTKEYLQAEDGIIQIKDYETTMTKLAAITKCHQAANGFLYIPCNEGGRTVHKIAYNDKLNWLIENLTDKPTVLVYRFEEDLNSLQDTLKNWTNYEYTDSVEDFKSGKASKLLLQCSRCESFNLQMCNNIIFYTLDYSFIKYNQMVHRVYRIGQNEKVNITILLFEKTIEESIWGSVNNKEKLSDLFMRIKGV